MAYYSFENHIPRISKSAYIHPSAVLIGNVVIGPGCYIGPSACLRGDFGKIVVDEESNIQDTCVIHGTIDSITKVCYRAHIGHGAILHGCVIEKNSLIGMNSIIMDSSIIGERSIVGAGSFVKSGFISGSESLIIGSPAKFLRKLTEKEMRYKGEATQRYIDLAKSSILGCKECKPSMLEQ